MESPCSVPTIRQETVRRLAVRYLRAAVKRFDLIWRQAKKAQHQLPPVTTVVIWLILIYLLLVRRHGGDTAVGPIPSGPSEVPYEPSEDPEFGMEEETELKPDPASLQLETVLTQLLTAEELSAMQRRGRQEKKGIREILSVAETGPEADSAPAASEGATSAPSSGSDAAADEAVTAPPTTTTTTTTTTTAAPEDESSYTDEEKTVVSTVFDWIEKPSGSCKRLLKIGGRIQAQGSDCPRVGHKLTCLDPPMRVATSPDCLVYSFSVQENDWSFDEAMAQLGCEVHTFNPRLDIPEGERSPGITFHRIGVGRNNHTDVNGWNIRTLDQIVRRLGHVGRPISYLKTNTDGWELDMLAQQLLDGGGEFVLDMVEQMGLEVRLRLHPRREMSFYQDAARSAAALHSLGYQVVSTEPSQLAWQRYRLPGVDHEVSLQNQVLLVKNALDSWDQRLQRKIRLTGWLSPPCRRCKSRAETTA